MTIETTTGALTEREFIERLTYACYVHNRQQRPDIGVEAWAQVLPNVPAMERKFQAEQAIVKAAA